MAYSWRTELHVNSIEEYNTVCKTKVIHYELPEGGSIDIKLKKKPKVSRMENDRIYLLLADSDLVGQPEIGHICEMRAIIAHEFNEYTKKIQDAIMAQIPRETKALTEFLANHNFDDLLDLVEQRRKACMSRAKAIRLYVEGEGED